MTTLMMMVVCLVTSMAGMQTTRQETQIAQSQLNTMRAFYYAESALAKSITELKYSMDYDANFLVGNIGQAIVDGDGKWSASFSGTTPTYFITAIGTAGNARRTVKATLTTTPLFTLDWNGDKN